MESYDALGRDYKRFLVEVSRLDTHGRDRHAVARPADGGGGATQPGDA